jgi:amino acid transporter
MFSAPRITYSLSIENNLPAWFGAVHPRFLTPANSVLAYGVLVFVAAAFGSFAWLAGMSALTRLGIYLLCIGALPRLRRLPGDPAGRLHLPGGWGIPVAAATVCAWLLAQVHRDAVFVTLAFLAVGAVLHLFARRGRPAAGT